MSPAGSLSGVNSIGGRRCHEVQSLSTDVHRDPAAGRHDGICRRVRRNDRDLQERRRKRHVLSTSYGYAVFPTVGKGGLGVGGAHGSGRAYVQGKHVGDVKMNQLSVGLQAGGQAFSQIIFFEDKRAFDEFTSGSFEFDATVQAVAITASATASAGTAGATAGAAGRKE